MGAFVIATSSHICLSRCRLSALPKAISPAALDARLTGTKGGRPVLAGGTNYLADLDPAFIVDVEATVPIQQAEVGAVRDMLVRTQDRFDLHPWVLAATQPLIGRKCLAGFTKSKVSNLTFQPLMSGRKDGAFLATDFIYDPDGKEQKPY